MRLLDLALLAMVVAWAANFSVVKYALRDFPEISFNALRLVLATLVFAIAIAITRRRAMAQGEPVPGLTMSDWRRLALLGVIGHFVYQVCFLGGVARTSVGNSALIFGCTPVTVAVLSSIAGHERIPAVRWIAVAISLAGIYALIGHRAEVSTSTLSGDLLVLAAMFCWSVYSVASQPLLRRHSPLVVTGASMAIGASLYLIAGSTALWRTNWSEISALSWMLMAASSLFALAFAYMVWYTAVQRLGSSRTAIYSNLTPIVAMVIAALTLGEPVSRIEVIGALAILSGVFLTRVTAVPHA